jgi:hypothetical protein
MILLAIWLIVTGALSFITITFVHMGALLAILAIAAGILLLLGR